MNGNNVFEGKRILSMVDILGYNTEHMIRHIIKLGGTVLSLSNKNDIIYEDDSNFVEKCGGIVYYSDSHYDAIDYILYDDKWDYEEMLEVKKKASKNCRPLSVTECQQILFDILMLDVTVDNPKIKRGTFRSFDYLTSVDIPDYVKTIEKEAFVDCWGLKTVNMPKSLKKIGSKAFSSCSELENVILPDGLKKIEEEAFSYCEKLNTVIPNSVSSIGNKAFYMCKNLNTNIPDSIERIGDEAFSGCKVDNLIVPKSVKEIGMYCFYGDISIYENLRGGINTLYGLITLLSDDGNVKYVVPMISDGTAKMSRILEDGWLEGKVEYDFSGLDNFFGHIAGKGVQKKIAKTRLKYPYGLSDEHKEMYEIFLGKKEGKNVINPEEAKKIEETYIKKYRINIEKDDEILKKASISTLTLLKRYPVLFKDSKKEVPQVLVRHVIAAYVKPMHGTDPNMNIIPKIDNITNTFDRDSFKSFLYELSDNAMERGVLDVYYQEHHGPEQRDRILSLLGRYADDEVIAKLIGAYDEKEKYYANTNRSSTAINYLHYLREAILLSDSNLALDFAKEKKWLPQYASKRGKKVNDYLKEIGSDLVLTEEEIRMEEALDLYKEIMGMILAKEEGYYNSPTVQDAPIIKPISKDNQQAKQFFEKLRNIYLSNQYNGLFDLEYTPEVLYQTWLDCNDIEEGMVGFSLTIGIAVASYMFESQDVSGSIVYCKDKWEYRGDYSSATRLAVNLSKDRKKWGVRKISGYEEYDM